MGADVLVVGAGPAGLATAIAASLRGLRVIVADSRRPPIDKTCGEGLLPDAVAALRSLGIELNSRLAFPFNGIRFMDEEFSVSGILAEGTAFGLRRTALSQLLIQRASEVGAEFLWGVRVSAFDSQSVRIDGARHSFRWLVGADGRDSAVGKWARLDARSECRARFGFRRHYSITPWTDSVEVYWGDQCQMFATPTGAQEVSVSVLTKDPHMRTERALPKFPGLARRLRGAPTLTIERGSVTALEWRRAVVRRNVALVGDASGSVDGIAGVGLSLAFQQAIYLGEALAREDLKRYQAAHRRIRKFPTRLNRVLLMMSESAWVRRKVLRLFAESPGTFGAMMSFHTGQRAPEELKAREVFDLGWRVLWA